MTNATLYWRSFPPGFGDTYFADADAKGNSSGNPD
jgi:hypothetical protein